VTEAESKQVAAATNQSLYREVNERVLELTQSWGHPVTVDVVCECWDGACAEPLTVAVDDYHRIRADALTFVVRPGHVDLDVEVVVEETGDAARFLEAVEEGQALVAARRNDAGAPRAARRPTARRRAATGRCTTPPSCPMGGA
jgi:hypothetical protein